MKNIEGCFSHQCLHEGTREHAIKVGFLATSKKIHHSAGYKEVVGAKQRCFVASFLQMAGRDGAVDRT